MFGRGKLQAELREAGDRLRLLRLQLDNADEYSRHLKRQKEAAERTLVDLDRLVEERGQEIERLTAPPVMSAADARDMLARDHCRHCGYFHSTAPACPRIKSITFTSDGTALSVKYWPHGQWPTEGLTHPDELAAIIAAADAAPEVSE